MSDIKRLVAESLAEIARSAKSGGPKVRVGLMAAGSEHGAEELLRGAVLSLETSERVAPVMIGPRVSLGEEREKCLDWIEVPDAEIPAELEKALAEGRVDGAVALHFPFPLGVTTIGRVVTPARGRPMIIASTTGTSAVGRGESMLRNAVYGIAVAKALGVQRPTVGVLNVDTAQPVFRALSRMAERGYSVAFGSSVRKDGGSVLRGNDILAGAVDVCVTDTLTGNVLVKMFSSYSTGGSYEALGWGYGPSCGEGWGKVVSIISRASGAPVIAGALALNAAAVLGGLPAKVAEELAAARKAGLDEEIETLTPKAAVSEDVKAPASEPTDEEIHGVDVLEIENAVKCLWKAGIYAESAMGCTGPVVKLSAKRAERAHEVLKENGYL
ncbi:MAG: glycine reductase [Synergistaceae bacterium]|jgi:betaine reductase|nr:glycine reductase [Synergistaceae bacterium]